MDNISLIFADSIYRITCTNDTQKGKGENQRLSISLK